MRRTSKDTPFRTTYKKAVLLQQKPRDAAVIKLLPTPSVYWTFVSFN